MHGMKALIHIMIAVVNILSQKKENFKLYPTHVKIPTETPLNDAK